MLELLYILLRWDAPLLLRILGYSVRASHRLLQRVPVRLPCIQPCMVRRTLPENVEDQHGHSEEVLGSLALRRLPADVRDLWHVLCEGQRQVPEAPGRDDGGDLFGLLQRLRAGMGTG